MDTASMRPDARALFMASFERLHKVIMRLEQEKADKLTHQSMPPSPLPSLTRSPTSTIPSKPRGHKKLTKTTRSVAHTAGSPLSPSLKQ